MTDPAEAPPALARVEAGGDVRSVAGDPRCRLGLDRAWGRVHAVELHAEPLELADGYLLHDVVALNLGADTACEANLGGAGWETVPVPHHAVGVLPARVHHAARSRAASELLLVELGDGFAAAALGTMPDGSGLRALRPARDSFAEHVMLALAEEARAGARAGAVRAESLGAALVTHLAEREPRPHVAPPRVAGLPSPTLRRVLDYVSFHLDQPLTLQRLADLAGTDVFRFVRAFKLSTGLSPHRYVLEARIARAKELLRARSLSITDVALQTGFATPSHFSVTFRRLTHLTPRAYRDGLES